MKAACALLLLGESLSAADLAAPWPAEWEREYQQRVQHVLDVWKTKKHGEETGNDATRQLYKRKLIGYVQTLHHAA